ncbi:PREDICTED: claudin-6-like [Chrysochloris asiatica]|uniref:Claudin n=1 Tax=Chrysochloris asiatica TaxID=185453 RepID=A0A9B0U8G0_CHRAS|nr:PREDICTED: claudin-6-like [Chrysochloris asiatica]
MDFNHLQNLGITLTILGWFSAMVSCILPMWKVTTFIDSPTMEDQVTWEGLWMSCMMLSTGQMQCEVYDSLLALPQDLQAARAFYIVALLVGLIALVVYLAAANCTTIMENKDFKPCLALTSGIILITSGVLTLIPICWTANTIIHDVHNPLLLESQKRELGASLYLGWAASGLLFLGGGLLCFTYCFGRSKFIHIIQFTTPQLWSSRSVEVTTLD